MRDYDGLPQLNPFALVEMYGRPVFIRRIGDMDNYATGYPPYGTKKCTDCSANAQFCVYELDGRSWYFCGRCNTSK